MTTRGVFKLSSYRAQELVGEGVPINDVWYLEQLQQVGYVVGGKINSNDSVSYYQSMSYSSDTRSNVANLPQARSGVYGLASKTNGYNIGGGPGNPSQPNNTYYTSTAKLVFSTQTSSALPGVNLTEPYGRGGSAGNTTAGYVCGGYSGPGGEGNGWSRLERLTYSTETMQRLPGSNLPGKGYGGATGWDHAATGNGDDFAVWIAGNIYPSPSSSLTGTCVFKLIYSSEQWSHSTSWNLSGPGNRMQKAGMTSSNDGAYIVGGSYPSNTRVQKISFADMTNSAVTNSASPGRTDMTATGNTSSGYFAGGATGNNANGTGGSFSSIVEKMNFSTNSISRVPALNLANGLSNAGSMSAAGDNKVPPAPQRWKDNAVTGGNAIDFDGSDDYIYQTITSPYALRNWWDQDYTCEYWINADSFGSSQNTGSNVVGVTNHSNTGETWSFGPRNTGEVLWYWWNGSVQRFYSGKTLSTNQWYHLAFVYESASGNMKIFVDGTLEASTTVSGSPSGGSTTFAIGRITQNPTYFNGSISNLRITHAAVYSENFTVPTEPLTEITGTKLLCCNQGSATAATITPDPFSKNSLPTAVVDKNLQFNLPPTPTPTDGQVVDQSVTVADAGYNMKGNTPGGLTSRISKIAFATDTKSNPGNMPTPGEHSTDFSSLTAAYSNSGAKGPSGLTSNAQKITYSTDSASSVPGGQTLNYQRQTAKCATLTHGYLAGGLTPSPVVSNFNKMTFSNETYSLLPAKIPSSGFPSPSGNTFMTGFNNSTAGYWGGGEGGGFPTGTSGVVKLTFATDTSSTNTGYLPTVLKESASLGNGEVAGYTLSGGAPSLPGSGHISYTSKMLYSTETFSIVPGAYWNPIRYRMTSFSSFNAGYSGMGSESNDAFSKMPWSTETWSSTPGNFPSGQTNTRDTGGGTSAKSNSGGKPKIPVVL